MDYKGVVVYTLVTHAGSVESDHVLSFHASHAEHLMPYISCLLPLHGPNAFHHTPAPAATFSSIRLPLLGLLLLTGTGIPSGLRDST